MDFLTNGPMGITLQKPLWWDLRDYADTIPFFDMSTARLKEFEFYFLVAACLLASLVAINRLIASRYAPRVRGAARCSDRVGLHGRQRLQAQGDRVRVQRRDGGAGRIAVRVFRAVCGTEQFRRGAGDPVPAGRDARRTQIARWAAAGRADHRRVAEPARRYRPVPHHRRRDRGRGRAGRGWRAFAGRRTRRRSSCPSHSASPSSSSRCCCRRSRTTSCRSSAR